MQNLPCPWRTFTPDVHIYFYSANESYYEGTLRSISDHSIPSRTLHRFSQRFFESLCENRRPDKKTVEKIVAVVKKSCVFRR